MKPNIIKLFVEKGFLLDKEMLDFLNELEDEQVAQEIINKVAFSSKKKIITKNLISENFDKLKPLFFQLDIEKKRLIEKFFVNISISVEVKRETIVENTSEEKNYVKIISSPIMASQKIGVKDFVKHFRNRYNFLKNILQLRTNLENLSSIDKINKNNRNFSIIGIVSSKQTTKNKNIILEVEDLTGMAKVLINQSKKEVFEKAKEILLDDVIGFRCSGTRDFLFVNDLFYPDSFLRERHRSEKDVYAVFISDSHVGSQNFLEKNFSRFIDWLGGKNCTNKQKEMIDKIKYLFVVGDSIEGVGIYPGQEKFLNIKDIKDQYVKLAEYYRKIPKHISIIQCAGQHDAVRVAEPQPPIGRDFGEALYEFDNLYLVSNPSLVEIEGSLNRPGIKVLMYHGASMNSIINEIEELRLSNAHRNPTSAVKHLLLRRHLSPVHGTSVYIPNAEEDSMLIKEVPDIIATGDLHRPDIDNYNGVLMIASSCWQSITPFEEKVGNIPDPCKAVVLNLKTWEIKMIDFSDIEEAKVVKECKEENIDKGTSKTGEGQENREIVCEIKN